MVRAHPRSEGQERWIGNGWSSLHFCPLGEGQCSSTTSIRLKLPFCPLFIICPVLDRVAEPTPPAVNLDPALSVYERIERYLRPIDFLSRS